MEYVRGDFKILTGKPKRKGPLRRPRHRCENNIRIDLNEISVIARIYWIVFVNAALNLNVP
jgi:hypothetical protein